MKRNKFRLSRFIIFNLAWVLNILSRFRVSEKRILVIRLDAIGDYILFRNYLEVLRQAKKFEDYEIELLGNKKWEDLTERFDTDFLSTTHFINPDELIDKPLQLFKFGLALFRRRYEIVLQPTYSRNLLINGLSALAAAKKNIAINSKNELQPRYKKKTDKFYTQLLELPADIVHERGITHFFFEQVIGASLPFTAPSLPAFNMSRSGIVIFPGASTHKRAWPKENFLEVIKRLLTYTNEPVIIAGGQFEEQVSTFLVSNLPPGSVVNTTGTLNLVGLVELIAGANLLLTNETSAVHIAAACNTPSICILGGGHFNRFTPYPSQWAYQPVCIYEKMPCYNCDWKCIFNLAKDEPYPCISINSLESVWSTITVALPSKNVI